MRNRTPLSALVLLLLVAGPVAAADGPHTLADLAWMAGRWTGTVDGMAGEETWNAALGDTMTGMFRLVGDGKAVFYEAMAIEQEDGGPVLKLRQFARGLVDARPDVLRFPLVRLGTSEAAFEGPDRDGSARLTYRRAGDELTVVLDKTRGGKSESRTFSFRLAR